MEIDELDISQHLYERLSTDKYGGWVEVFGREPLKQLCDRITEEIEPPIFEWMAKYESDFDEAQQSQEEAMMKLGDAEEKLLLLTESHKKLVERLDKIGLVWDTEAKTLDITEDSPIRKLKF